jgi:hypothetical protein
MTIAFNSFSLGSWITACVSGVFSVESPLLSDLKPHLTGEPALLVEADFILWEDLQLSDGSLVDNTKQVIPRLLLVCHLHQ